jgi:hypothetical protein
VIWQSRASKGPADVGGTYVGEPLRVGNFNEQVWGDSDERDHGAAITYQRADLDEVELCAAAYDLAYSALTLHYM